MEGKSVGLVTDRICGRRKEGEEKKTKTFGFRKHGFRKNEVTEEEKAVMGSFKVYRVFFSLPLVSQWRKK